MWQMAAAAAAQTAAQAMQAPPSGASGTADGWGMFDNSGWTVATGGSRSDGATIGAKGGDKGTASGAGGMLAEMVPWIIVGIVGIAVARAWAKK